MSNVYRRITEHFRNACTSHGLKITSSQAHELLASYLGFNTKASLISSLEQFDGCVYPILDKSYDPITFAQRVSHYSIDITNLDTLAHTLGEAIRAHSIPLPFPPEYFHRDRLRELFTHEEYDLTLDFITDVLSEQYLREFSAMSKRHLNDYAKSLRSGSDGWFGDLNEITPRSMTQRFMAIQCFDESDAIKAVRADGIQCHTTKMILMARYAVDYEIMSSPRFNSNKRHKFNLSEPQSFEFTKPQYH